MRFVSYLVFVNRAGRSEQAAFTTQRRIAPDRGLTIATHFWAGDALEHQLQVVDEPAVGSPRIVAARTVTAPAASGLLSVDLALPSLATPGPHRLHLDLDGERVMTEPIAVTVREIHRRGQRSRYKGRGTLATMPDGPVAAGGYLRHGELFPLERPTVVGGTVSGLWIAAYFQGFRQDDEGPHLFSVQDAAACRVVGVKYSEVSGPDHSLTLPLDPIDAGGPRMLALAIDGRDVGLMRLSL